MPASLSQKTQSNPKKPITVQRFSSINPLQRTLLRESLKLSLSHLLTHGRRARNTSGNHLQHVIDVVRAGPLLVSNHVDSILHLRLLNQRAISLHAVLGEVLRKGVGDEGGRVQARKGDELPAVAELAEARNVGFLLLTGHGG